MFAVMLLMSAALAQQPPAPQPFPRAGAQQPGRPGAPPPAQPPPPRPTPAPPSSAVPPPAQEAAPGESQLGVAIYPGAQFLASYDAGRGQRYFLFGSSASFLDVVTFYRNLLK